MMRLMYQREMAVTHELGIPNPRAPHELRMDGLDIAVRYARGRGVKRFQALTASYQ